MFLTTIKTFICNLVGIDTEPRKKFDTRLVKAKVTLISGETKTQVFKPTFGVDHWGNVSAICKFENWRDNQYLFLKDESLCVPITQVQKIEFEYLEDEAQ